ncbi:hypothetical protein GCM10018793_49770 [Streptomyces sulfonofaciens]|uniref:Secreted protein n=1 Tax=Streptomyces sulfonofaciens TaxID=68272 RepID=A0A919GHL3_9ACTN|nr:hypothetical protein [Streptomyces sulfonofaciens]GHH84679.1 hypothetical protein GCM10018793_49770 [Streptomyces sulfonofaciens]
MNARQRRTTRLLTVTAAVVSTAVLAVGPARAAEDSTAITTPEGCGGLDYDDYGPGAAGGGDNDDYFVIHDYCGDYHGVKAWAWQNGTYLGGRYNGNGLAGAAVVWDPFKDDNVAPHDRIGMKVCLVDGDDGAPFACTSYTFTSIDG